jgi:pimeloyl-ACP methyl ester carboxylesterase
VPGIYFKEKGSGIPLILIHGFCETHEIWQPVVDPLAQTNRVIAIDLPGFGKSAPLPAPFSIDDAADAVGAFLKSIPDLQECIVLGHSLGGYVTLALAERFPERVSAFGLIHSTAFADSDERKTSRLKVIEFVHQYGVAAFIESFIPPLFADRQNPAIKSIVAQAAQTPLDTLVSYTEAMRNRPDRTSFLYSFQRPVLFLAGVHDSVIPVEGIEQQASQTPYATVSILDHVGHMGMVEDPESVRKSVVDFTSRHFSAR